MARIIILLLMSVQAAAETTVYLGGVSYHFANEYNYNHNHRIIAAEHNGYIGGYFKNSFYEDSYLAGYRIGFDRRHLELSLLVGVTYGYRSCDKKTPVEGPRKICPMVAPGITFTKYKVRPSIVVFGPAVVLSVSIPINFMEGE